MRKLVPFKKDINFDTNVAVINSISLEHEIKTFENNLLIGKFIISGDYKMTDTSPNLDTFEYELPFNINIDKSINRKSISCPSHKINVIDEDKTERVEVLNYDLSKDFKLLIELKNELSSNAITSKTRDENDMIYLSFMPKILDSYEDSEKEYLFIINE